MILNINKKIRSIQLNNFYIVIHFSYNLQWGTSNFRALPYRSQLKFHLISYTLQYVSRDNNNGESVSEQETERERKRQRERKRGWVSPSAENASSGGNDSAALCLLISSITRRSRRVNKNLPQTVLPPACLPQPLCPFFSTITTPPYP